MKGLVVWTLVALASTVLSGCRPKQSDLAGEGPVVLGPQYSAKKGLLLPEETRRSLGVKIVEVAEQKISTRLDLAVRVYQSNDKASLASGTVGGEQANLWKAGQRLEASASDGTKFPAKVTSVNHQLQKATGLAEVLVEIRHSGDALAVGTFVEAHATIDGGQAVLTIPRAALLQCTDGYSVYTVSGEHLIRTAVKVGAMNSDLVEITDGLYAGDQVVLRPVMSLWLTELAAVKGGQACCVEPKKGK
jgi:hypothetical protein